MTDHALKRLNYLANCSILFTELPLLERPAAAKAAGFDAIEFWWPWPDQPVPADADVDAFVGAVRRRRRAARRLNFFAGDLAGAGLRRAVDPCAIGPVPRQHRRHRRHRRAARRVGVQRAVRQPGRRRDAAASRTSWHGPTSARLPTPPRASARPSWSKRSAVRSRTRCARPTTRSRSCTPYATPATRTSPSCATCSISPTTATTSTRRSPSTPTSSATCRSPTGPGAASRAPASSTSTATSPISPRRGYAGWVGLEYKPTTDTETSLALAAARAPRGLALRR